MKILEVIQRTTEFFSRKGVEQPRLQIELLLAHALRKKRLELYLEFEREMDAPILEHLRELVRRRAEGEPLQYIVGSVNFHGIEMATDRRALIPRPETEILLETVLERLAPQKGSAMPAMRILDLCTGSGCVAIALAKHLPEARIVATDISAEALELARENAERSGVGGQVKFRQGDLFAAVSGETFHAVVANPPYIGEGERESLAREIREHEPAVALIAGATGLEVIEKIICGAPIHVLCCGLLALEVGAGQHKRALESMNNAGFRDVEVVKDLAGIERVVVGRAA